MGRYVYITTPIPTLDEVGKSLKMSKARQYRLIEIVTGSAPGQVSKRHRAAVSETRLSLRTRKSANKRTVPQVAAKISVLSKKSKRATAAS